MDQSSTAFFVAHLPALGNKLLQQIFLAGIATCSAILIGVPAGIWVLRVRAIKRYVIGFASVMQTVPSIALLAFLLPFLGIGFKPALIALTLYALLPIVRNTVTGLERVPKDMIEAANGLGFTRRQRLHLVELPLAMPTIIAGIRTASSLTIGVATLAAFIGAGGLGDFIYQGLTLSDNRLVLLGAVPAALLALGVDYFIGKIESTAQQYKRKSFVRSRKKPMLVTFAVILLSVGGLLYWPARASNRVVIGTKHITEQYILGNMMADLIEAKTDLRVEKKFNLGATSICQNALLHGDIDMYPEYTGTGYMVVLHHHKILSPRNTFSVVKKEYLKAFHLVWLPPFGFDNTQMLVVRDQFAKQHRLHTVSDLLSMQGRLSIGAAAAFLRRPDAYPGLNRIYGLRFSKVRQMTSTLMYRAVADNRVDVIMAYSTDARIRKYHLAGLRDDKHLYPPYYAAPVVREAVLEKHPEIKTALQPLAGIINDKVMQQLNYDVDIKGMSPTVVAKNFLVKHKLL